MQQPIVKLTLNTLTIGPFSSSEASKKFPEIETTKDVLSTKEIRVASFKGAAYDLWLERNLPAGGCTIVQAASWQVKY